MYMLLNPKNVLNFIKKKKKDFNITLLIYTINIVNFKVNTYLRIKFKKKIFISLW